MTWRKYGEIRFLTSRNVNNHIYFLAFGVNHTARDKGEIQCTGVSSMFPCYIGLVSPKRHQANAVELITEYSLFDVNLTHVVQLTSCAKGKLWNLWCLRNLWLPQCTGRS